MSAKPRIVTRDGPEEAEVDDRQLHEQRRRPEEGDVRAGDAPHDAVFAQPHQRQQQRRDDGQQDGHDRQQQRVFQPSHERRRVFGQEGEIEEVRLVHVDEQVAPPHRIWFLSLLREALLHLALEEARLPLFFDETSNVRKVQGRKAALHFAGKWNDSVRDYSAGASAETSSATPLRESAREMNSSILFSELISAMASLMPGSRPFGSPF